MRLLLLLIAGLSISAPVCAAGFADTGSRERVEPESAENNRSAGFQINQLVDYIDYDGPGCRYGEVDYEVSSNGQTLRLRYYDLNAASQYGQRDSSDCDVVVGFDVPRRYRMAIRSVTVDGSADISDRNSEAGTIISLDSSGYNWSEQLTSRTEYGPWAGDYRFQDTLANRDMQWSECGGFSTDFETTISTSVYTRASSRGWSEMSGVRSLGFTQQDYEIVYERCDQPNPPPFPGDHWHGECTVILETLWGNNISEHFGESCANSRREAVSIATQNALQRCEQARGNQNLLTCNVTNDCGASYTHH